MWRTAVGVQENVAPFISERVHALSRDPATLLNYYARIVRAVQVGVHDYMQGVATNVAHGVVGIEIPNFTAMIQDLKRGTFHNSSNWMELPTAYLEAPSTSPRTANTAPSAVATTISQSLARSSVSSLTAEPTATRLTRVKNPGRWHPKPNPGTPPTSQRWGPGNVRRVVDPRRLFSQLRAPIHTHPVRISRGAFSAPHVCEDRLAGSGCSRIRGEWHLTGRPGWCDAARALATYCSSLGA